MITHISLYELTDMDDLPLVQTALEEMSNCPLIMQNEVRTALFHPTEITDALQFASIAHIAIFQTKKDALEYPDSLEHRDLVRKTGKYIRHVMSIDYERKTDA